MELFNMDLGPHGAPGFNLRDRLDMTGHGHTDPHINTDMHGPGGLLRGPYYGPCGPADFRDLTHNQLPGFNGMQFGP